VKGLPGSFFSIKEERVINRYASIILVASASPRGGVAASKDIKCVRAHNTGFACTLGRDGVRRNGRFQARGPSSLGDGAIAGGVANACDNVPELWIGDRFAPGGKPSIPNNQDISTPDYTAAR
jgi:hypothetical protein